jgi:peptide-methionine (S)-S-oxide reductase
MRILFVASAVLALACAAAGGSEDLAAPDKEVDVDVKTPVKTDTATFGAGCFWGVEHSFRQVKGVVNTAVGYAGGNVDEPTYRQVCSGNTGHAEVVQVEFDPEKVSYDQLLETFWSIHDPTTKNRQGPDIGYQYRSVIFYHSAEQQAAAEASKKKLDESGKYHRPVVTAIEPAGSFWRAEEYHQRYYEKHGVKGCAVK